MTSLQWLQTTIEQLTSLLLAIGAFGAAFTSLWQSLRNRRRIGAMHEQMNSRMEAVERRGSEERRGGSERRQAPPDPPA